MCFQIANFVLVLSFCIDNIGLYEIYILDLRTSCNSCANEDSRYEFEHGIDESWDKYCHSFQLQATRGNIIFNIINL